MVYKCLSCDYTSVSKFNYERHIRRKRPCSLLNDDVLNVNADVLNVNANDASNVNADVLNNNDVSNIIQHKCNQCTKVFKKPIYLKRHEKICKGVDPLSCPICLLQFNNRITKYNHLKKGVCTSPSDITNELEKSSCKNEYKICFNGPQHNVINNITNSTTNNISQHVHINVFGKEDFNYLLKDGNLIQKLKIYSKKGVYGLADVINELHCNKEIPENNTIIKPLEYGDGVYIMGEANEWEFREFEDVRDTLIDSLSKYVEKYNNIKKKTGIKLTDRRERSFIKAFAYQLLAIDGEIPDDLFEELEINEDKVKEDNDFKIKNMLRKFDRTTMLKLYEYTCANYKKDNGKYVVKK
jgi:hypothetical protein